MDRERLTELHYITHVDNVPSILKKGLLCNSRSAKLKHVSVALADIQDLRSKVLVPNGLRLHAYANLYLDARNPMLYKRRSMHNDLTVLRITPDVLDIPDAVIADGNASSRYTAFLPSPDGLASIDADRVFAEYWTSPNQIEQWENARIKCAELLVPGALSAQYITGAYVSNEQTAQRLEKIGLLVNALEINPWFFFR